jgi:hypothetical protein
VLAQADREPLKELYAVEGSGHVGHKADAPDQAFPHSLFDSVIDAFGKSQVIGSEDQSFHKYIVNDKIVFT